MTEEPDVPSESRDTLSPNKRALLRIRQLKQQLATAQQGSGGPIAIVSMACRFPRASRTPEEFWQCLMAGSDEVTDIPEDRWDLDAFYDEDPEVPGKMYARRGVFLENLDLMDPEFFGISPREATWVDPQQRLLMEVGWEALERAGWPAEKIGADTGIFVGWMHNDYQNEASDSFLNLNPYIATGAAGSFLCGRLAYYLGLQGPSLAVDTACSSSLVALHLACQSLQRGDCSRALVGGVNAIVSPTTNILTCKLKALSPKGHSRAFDAAADGYLRGEGCGVVTLRRLADAERDGDPILGIIRGSSVGHNGFSGGLTAPNPQAQQRIICQALERAGIHATDVDYLEAHGTGTELGDPIELQAAAAALAVGRDPQKPLLVGSVKTNIGHLEAAAGMAGLIKVLLAMQNNTIPAQLHFETPNPHIPWDKIRVRVVTEPTSWPDASGKHIAGVSAFGMSGTNAHVVIESPPPATRVSSAGNLQGSDSRWLFVVSGKSDEALQAAAANLRGRLTDDPSLELADVGYTLCATRTHFAHRAAIVVRDRSRALEALRTLERGGTCESVCLGTGKQVPKTAWQFTGQGSQYAGMARGLYDSQPVFRQAIDHCATLIQRWRGQSLMEVLHDEGRLLDHTSWTQPAIFAVQMGLAQLLDSWGLTPDAVLGHSVGQYAAACVAGIMSWDDGFHLICERGRLIGELPEGGRMLAVFAPLVEVEKASANIGDLSLAAMNGTHIVVSGPDAAVDEAERRFGQTGFRTKPLTTSHAFHSSLMDAVVAPFRTIASEVTFVPAKIPLICNVTGAMLAADAVLDGEYWSQHIRQPVQYAAGVAAAQEMGCEVLLEIGPQSVLTRMAAANWRGAASSLISCLHKGADAAEAILKAVGQLYAHGAAPDFDALYRHADCRQVVLPTYPFQRRRFWGPDKPRAFHAEYHTAHPLLGSKIQLADVPNETRYQSYLEPDSPSWLPDHQVMDRVVVPGAAFIEMAITAAGTAELQEIVFERPIQPNARTAVQTVIRRAGDEQKTISIFSVSAEGGSWTRNFRARLVPAAGERISPIDRARIESNCSEVVSTDEFYRKMADLGLNYGPAFQTIDSLRYSDSEVLARLKVRGDVRGFTWPPTVLDGALHCLAVGLLREDNDYLFLPVGIGRVSCWQSIESEVWCHAVWKKSTGEVRLADLLLFAEDGQIVASIKELSVQQLSRASLRKMSGSGAERLLYEMKWQGYRLPAATTKSTEWLVVRSADASEAAAKQLSAELVSRGHSATNLKLAPSAEFARIDARQYRMCGESLEGWNHLLETASGDLQQPLAGIVWLLDAETESNCRRMLTLVRQLQRRRQGDLACGLQLVTTGAIQTGADASVAPHMSKFWGLGRVIGAEHPELKCRLMDADMEASRSQMSSLSDILLTETHENQFALRGEEILVPRLKQAELPKKEAAFSARPDGCYLITGGLGVLGRHAARWLAKHGAKEVVLVSRRSPDAATQSVIDSIEELGCQVFVHRANIGSRHDVEEIFARFGNDLRPLAGVIHAAGVLDDGLLTDQTWERFESVLSPKARGAELLDEFTRNLALDFFVLYSSAASVFGSPGQSNYALANAFLDGLAAQRQAAGLPATSINWGPWTAGMAADERIAKRLSLQGITPLGVDEAHDALEKLLVADIDQATVMDVDWRKMRIGMGSLSPALLEDLAPAKRGAQVGDSQLVAKLKQLQGSAKRQLLVQSLQSILQVVLSSAKAPETDRPLIEMGLDSLMAVEFGTELQQQFGGQLDVGPTMLFEHPTIDAITDHILDLMGDEAGAVSPTESKETIAVTNEVRSLREDVAIIGMSCRFPGARNVDEFWNNLLRGVDAVCDIPDDRWDIDRFYSSQREPGKMYSRQGGFLDDIGDFDAAFFNISDDEARWIDPQHRMLLENSYQALEDAGIAPHPLGDKNVGVFMGIMGQDYAFLPSLDDAEIIKAFQGAGLSHSAGVGRISYFFGFEGPCIAVDTASSSSLVALIQAVRSLQDGNCNMALAGGVNAILAPVNSLLMSKVNLLAPDGRCKSFSARADGFGRGEGCGVVVLKRLSDAERDGDRIMAVFRGGAIVHNGFSGAITSPSGKSQTRAITEALQDASLAPSQVQYLEAHGTGTEFGDSMELAAAASAYGKGRQLNSPLLVGSVKANISHLEAAGGVSGLIKTVMSLYRGVIPPQIHFDEPSSHIPWERLPVRIVTEATDWPETNERTAGITALGLVGTNAHVILSAAAVAAGQTDDSLPERPVQLIVASARSAAALRALVASYHEHLVAHADIELADFCHTIAIGRKHHEFRAAFTVTSRADAIQQLKSYGADRLPPHYRAGNGRAAGQARESESRIPVTNPKLAWLFTGDATGNLDVGRELYQYEPEFRSMIDELDERLKSHVDDGPAPGLVDHFSGARNEAPPSDVHLFALQAGTAKLWLSWGIEPEAVLGFGVGQFTSACVAGCLCFLDALTLVWERQKLVARELADDLHQSLDEFEAFADTLNYYPPNLPLVCSLSGNIVPVHRSLGGSYWREQCIATSQEAAALQSFVQLADSILEISPVRSDLSALESETPMPPSESSLLAKPHACASMLYTLGRIYTAGANPDFKSFNQYWSRSKLSLPTYPFEKQRYWITEMPRSAERRTEAMAK